MVYMRNNNNFRNQNRQIQNDSNNENNDRIRNEEENNSNKVTQRALKVNYNNQNRGFIGDVISIIPTAPNKKDNDNTNTNRFVGDKRGNCNCFGICC